ncbi:g2656 [Coccomyxa viridis]|uniref:G2656 protein n=1 Tax=Coccomyxa viridis TaxID=1274662 RepID=A0ABP1FKW6_9CHLO
MVHVLVLTTAVLAGFTTSCTGGRELSDVEPASAFASDTHSYPRDYTLSPLRNVSIALDATPLEGKDPERSLVAVGLASINRDWRPYVVLGVGELLGYIVRSITGFGSAIVIVAVWTVCQTCGLDSGPFQTLIFADSICSLATAAPLVYITKPWQFASWRLVVTLLSFQAIGATAGAYLVQHLEPHNLQFAIATSLLVVFILMVCPLAKLLKRFQDAQARRLGARQPLLPGNSPEGSGHGRSWAERLGLKRGTKDDSSKQDTKKQEDGLSTGHEQAAQQPPKRTKSAFADMRFSEDDWEVMRSRVRRLGRSGSPAPGSLMGSKAEEEETDDQGAPLLLSRRQSDSASSLRGAEGSHRARGGEAVNGGSPPSIQEEPAEGGAGDTDQVLPPGPARPMMSQQKSGSFRQREAERLRRFIAARQSSGGLGQDGAAPLDPVDPIRATEEADPVANLPSRAEPAEAHQHEQTGGVGPGEVIKGSLSAEVGPVLIGVVSHAGSPRPESPTRQGSVAHIGREALALQQETSVEQASSAEAQPLLERSASHKARHWTIATPKLIAAGALAGTSAGCLATLSGIGGPPLILMYELLAVPKQVVRATQTTMGCLSVKFFTYLLLGVGKWSNLPLYGMAIAISLVGLNIGNAISKRMDQRMFSNLLLAMMFVSTILLYCASYGLTGR